MRIPARNAIGLGLLWAVALLIVAEVIVRAEVFPTLSRAAEPPPFHPLFQDLAEEDALLFVRLRPAISERRASWGGALVRTNRYGLRGPEVEQPKRAGVRRVVVMGGSALWGLASNMGPVLEERDICTGRLAALLPGAETAWEVVNAGMLSFSSLQGRRHLRRDLMALEPDVLVLSYGWNDHYPAFGGVPDAQRHTWTPVAFRLHRALQAWRSIRVARAFWARLPQVHRPSAPAGAVPRVPRVSPTDFAENLAAMVALGRSGGATVIIMTEPIAPVDAFVRAGAAASEVRREPARYAALARAVAREHAVPLADADAWISGRPEYFDQYEMLDLTHYNAAGHARIAEGLAGLIVSTPPLSADADQLPVSP